MTTEQDQGDVPRWKREMEERNGRTKERLALNKGVMLEALRAVDAAGVLVFYSGSGDSGQIDAVELLNVGGDALDALAEDGGYGIEPSFKLDAGWEDRQVALTIEKEEWGPSGTAGGVVTSPDHRVVRSVREMRLEDALEYFCDDWVDVEHGGYENNDGGQGYILIDVESGAFKLHHEDNFTSHEDSEDDL